MKSKAEIDAEKQLAAKAVLRWVKSGMRLGLGSGSTSEWFARHLAEALKTGALRDIVVVPTSEKVGALARGLGIELIALAEGMVLDLAVDGADEIGPGLELIKGGGAALLREKVVAAASRRSLIFADSTKLVARLGTFPLPIEVAPFAMGFVKTQIGALGGRGQVRLKKDTGEPLKTDQGLWLVDCHFGDPAQPSIENARALQNVLAHIPGVAGHGLFLDTTSAAIVADGDQLTVLTHELVLMPEQVDLEKLPAPRNLRRG